MDLKRILMSLAVRLGKQAFTEKDFRDFYIS